MIRIFFLPVSVLSLSKTQPRNPASRRACQLTHRMSGHRTCGTSSGRSAPRTPRKEATPAGGSTSYRVCWGQRKPSDQGSSSPAVFQFCSRRRRRSGPPFLDPEEEALGSLVEAMVRTRILVGGAAGSDGEASATIPMLWARIITDGGSNGYANAAEGISVVNERGSCLGTLQKRQAEPVEAKDGRLPHTSRMYLALQYSQHYIN